MPKSSAPATELQDALSGAVSAFMKAANHALVSVEEGSKEELRRALQDVRELQRNREELRRERDALLHEKMTTAAELEVAKCESERWKAATEKAEWMINHQTETIAQLRREAQQWKDQFIRVDEERLRLSARNDELVSQQLYANRRDAYYQAPLTPRSQGPQMQGSSSTRATSSNEHISATAAATGYVTDGDVLSRRASRGQSNAQLPRAKVARNASTHTKAQPAATSSRHMSHPQPASTVLRTVHVVMQGGPVKEENLDSVALATDHIGSESLGEEEEVRDEIELPLPMQSQKRPIGKRKAGQSARRKWSEGKRIYDDEESNDGTASEGDGDEYVPPRKSRAGQADEDEDELMLGGEVDRHETYGTQKTLVSETRRAQTQPARQTNVLAGSGRKRSSPYPPGKKARKR